MTAGRTAARRRHPVALAVAGLLTLALAGCTGGTGEDAASATPAESPAASPSASAKPTPEATPTPTLSPEEAFEEASAAYEACLVANGSSSEALPVNEDLDALADLADAPAALAERGLDPVMITAHATCWPAFSAAMAAGAVPPAAPEPVEEPIDEELAAKLHEAVECLNERGWDFLEPGVETEPLTMAPRDPNFSWDAPGALEDQQECQQLAGMMD